jgi:hypothetical protein
MTADRVLLDKLPSLGDIRSIARVPKNNNEEDAMKFSLSAVAVVVCLAALAWAGEENPLKKAKVGDWIEYRMVMNAGPLKIDGKSKITVTAASDKELELETVSTVFGKEQPPMKKKVDLTKPFDPLDLADLGKGGAKVEKGKEGKETIKIGDKEYKCTWTQLKVAGKDKKPQDADVKVWLCKDVPLNGLVKMELTAKEMDMEIRMTLELTGSGRK